eukprot:scaffold7344_cov145-Cylindrotheca_fusiformis.AAC.25
MNRFLEESLEDLATESHHGDPDILEGVQLATLVVIVLALILLTIIFEEIKEHIEHHVPDSLVSVVDRLFGELMVLGFLSIVTFILSESHVFAQISIHIFGKDEAGEFGEYFEFVHYSIFFLMVMFCAKVIELLVSAKDNHETWHAMERCVREKRLGGIMTDKVKEMLKHGSGLRRYSTIKNMFGKNVGDKPELNQMLYEGFREEFMLERSVEYPFEPLPPEARVDIDFNFGSYLVRCNTKVLESIIDIKPSALILIACGVVCYYGFAMLVGGKVIILAWTWVLCGFFVLAFNMYFEWYLVNLRDQFLPRRILQLWCNEENRERNLTEEQYNMSISDLIRQLEGNDNLQMEEGSSLLDNASNAGSSYSNSMSRAELPMWCDVDLGSIRQSCFVRKLVRGIPDRQQALFWFSHKGPEVFILILQIQLLFIGIFVGFVVLHYAPFIYRHNGTWMTVLYLVLSLGPLYFIDRNNKPLINVLSQINCIGHLRKPHIVSDVLMEEKSANVVQVFLVLYKIRKFAEAQATHPDVKREPHVTPSEVHAMMDRNTHSFTNLELHEVGKTFDAIDDDGSGEIDREEMRQVMLRMGANISTDGLNRLFSLLDTDNSGTIERDEFIAWYADHMESDKHISPTERAHELFNTFNLNHVGEITIGMFKRKLDNFKFGFTIDEIGAIANELDRDRSGTISLHEFERMLHKYHPKGSKNSGNHSHSNGH